MATMVSVDLGAQSGRVALGRFDGERLAVSTVHRFPNVPVRTRGTLHWDVLRLFDGVLDGLRAAGRDARPRRLRRRRLLGRRLRAARSCRPTRSEPGQLPRHAARGRHGRRAREGVRRASSTSAPGIQLMPINTVFELAAMAAERRPGAGGGGDAADDPRPHALLARRQRGLRVHERDDDAVLRRHSAGPGRATSSSGSGSRRRSCPRWCHPRRRSRRSRRDVADETRLDGAIGGGRRDARHSLGGRGDPAGRRRARRSSARERGRSSGSSCRGR